MTIALNKNNEAGAIRHRLSIQTIGVLVVSSF